MRPPSKTSHATAAVPRQLLKPVSPLGENLFPVCSASVSVISFLPFTAWVVGPLDAILRELLRGLLLQLGIDSLTSSPVRFRMNCIMSLLEEKSNMSGFFDTLLRNVVKKLCANQ